MKVLAGSGQMCNLLWSYTPIISHSLIHKEHLFILDFTEYIHLFPNTKQNKYIHFVHSKTISKVLLFSFKILKKLNMLASFSINEKTKGISYVYGWEYRQDFSNSTKVKEDIYSLFSPKEEVKRKCKSLFEENNESLIIGVHLRRGDYIDFFNGKYFFNDETINNFMGQITKEFPERKIKFFIASNENVNLDSFLHFHCFKHISGSSMDDLYSLSLCDYIIGPPSTYSMWASFYGGKPLLIIDSKDKKLKLSDFDIIKACDVFESGSTYTHPT